MENDSFGNQNKTFPGEAVTGGKHQRLSPDEASSMTGESGKTGEKDQEVSSSRSQTGGPSSRPSRMQLRKQASLREAHRICALLLEPNVSSVQRMIEIFGASLVSQKAEEAFQLYQEAEKLGPGAYSEPNTPVATGKSRPRTRGGVFFYLVKQHCAQLGLDWEGLKIASSLWFEEGKAKRDSFGPESGSRPVPVKGTINNREGSTRTSGPRPEGGYSPPAASVNLSSQKEDKDAALLSAKQSSANNSSGTSNPAKGENEKKEATRVKSGSSEPSNGSLKNSNPGTKPSRLKATLTGTLTGSPKFNPNGREGLVELQFKVEMNPSLPKGLPNLGESRVLVWCTKKQYEKVNTIIGVTPQTRFLIEGEPVPAVSADLSPFMRLVCTRLSTLELEQVRKEDQENRNQS